MEHYEIIMTPDSIRDLSDLRNYVADVLLARETALKLIQHIRGKISKLSELPEELNRWMMSLGDPVVSEDCFAKTFISTTALTKPQSVSMF